jgi:hypothetical protein
MTPEALLDRITDAADAGAHFAMLLAKYVPTGTHADIVRTLTPYWGDEKIGRYVRWLMDEGSKTRAEGVLEAASQLNLANV